MHSDDSKIDITGGRSSNNSHAETNSLSTFYSQIVEPKVLSHSPFAVFNRERKTDAAHSKKKVTLNQGAEVRRGRSKLRQYHASLATK